MSILTSNSQSATCIFVLSWLYTAHIFHFALIYSSLTRWIKITYLVNIVFSFPSHHSHFYLYNKLYTINHVEIIQVPSFILVMPQNNFLIACHSAQEVNAIRYLPSWIRALPGYQNSLTSFRKINDCKHLIKMNLLECVPFQSLGHVYMFITLWCLISKVPIMLKHSCCTVK